MRYEMPFYIHMKMHLIEKISNIKLQGDELPIQMGEK